MTELAGTSETVEIPAQVLESRDAARQAGLRYVSDDRPGIVRRRRGKAFQYLDPEGRPVRDAQVLERIRRLVIPPAWTDVWICPHANGHLQATGRDQRGRKQYRYHSRWREVRDENKFGRMLAFGRTLPLLRTRVAKDIARPGLPREKVLATIVRLLETTLIRVGNEEYARTNKSFGLTTLRDQHVDIEGGVLQFEFRAKSGRMLTVRLRDRRLAKIVKTCQDIPGQELFQYIDEDGTRQHVDSADVNDYIREVCGQDFTAKDFRTWAGTVLAALALEEVAAFDSQTAAKRHLAEAVKRVAGRLGNTPTVCRKCYIHPEVIDAYLDGALAETLRQRVQEDLSDRLAGLDGDEAAVLAFLYQRLEREAGRRPPASSPRKRRAAA